MSKILKTLLTIAGSDPLGGAGIQADLCAGKAMGYHVMSAFTALTVQNSKGLYEVNPVESSFLEKQLEKILEDCLPDAIKIGMLGSIDNFIVVEKFLKNIPKEIPVVVDPVLKATSNGNYLFYKSDPVNIARLYINNIFPWSSVATPNISEFKILLNRDRVYLKGHKKLLSELSLNHVILKGGDKRGSEIVDKLIGYEGIKTYHHKKIKCRNLHGTGCVYSSLLACQLGLGNSMDEAFMSVNRMMQEIIERSCDYTLGNSKYGPLNITEYLL